MLSGMAMCIWAYHCGFTEKVGVCDSSIWMKPHYSSALQSSLIKEIFVWLNVQPDSCLRLCGAILRWPSKMPLLASGMSFRAAI